MSYILDALRRAQAERERGQVPGLHAQQGLGGAPRVRAAGTPARRPAWLWALAGAALVAVLMLPMWVLQRGGAGLAAPGAATGPAALRPPAELLALPAAADSAAPLVVVSAGPVTKGPPAAAAAAGRVAAPSAAPSAAPFAGPSAAPAAPVTPAPTPARPAAGVQATAAAAQPAAPAAKMATPPLQPTAAMAAASAQPASVADAVSAPAPPPLTAEQRRDWPQLAVGGSVWSDTPAARFVILGGQVVREGESTADGVLVERITPKAVVLRWRDQRGSLAF